MRRHMRYIGLGIVGLGSSMLVLTASSVFAAGYGVRNQSASHMGTAFAKDGVGKSDPSAIFSNPASLSLLKGSQFSGGIAVLQADVSFKDGEASNAAGQSNRQPTTSTEADSLGSTGVIPFFYSSNQVSDDISVGVSFNVPWAAKIAYDDDWIGRYHALDTDLSIYNLTPMMSYTLNDTFSFGAGLQLQYAKGRLESASDVGLSVFQASKGLVGSPGQDDAIVAFDGAGFGYGAVAGVLARFDHADLGLSYRSRVTHKLKGEVNLDPSTEVAKQGLGSKAGRFDAETDITTPDVLSLAGAYQATNDIGLYASAALTRWSVFEDLNLRFLESNSITEQKWQDSLYLALGGEYALNQHWVFRGGIAVEEGAAQDKAYRTPRTPDSDRRLVAVGTGYTFAQGMSLDVSYSHIWYDEADVDLKAQGYNLARGNLSGTFEKSANILMVQTAYTL